MKIENWKDAPQDAKFIASFDVYLPNSTMTLRNLKLAIAKTGRHYFQWPSFCVEDGMGNKKWVPYYEFSQEKKREFEEKLKQEIIPLMNGPWFDGKDR